MFLYVGHIMITTYTEHVTHTKNNTSNRNGSMGITTCILINALQTHTF